MLVPNSHLIVKVTPDALLFDSQHALPINCITLKLSGPTQIENFTTRFQWLKLKVRKYESGHLLCEIVDFNPWEKRVFDSQSIDTGAIKKLTLFSADTFKILKLAKRKTPEKKALPHKKIDWRTKLFQQPEEPSPQRTSKPPTQTQKPKPASAPKPKPVSPNPRPAPEPPPKPKPIQKTIHFKVPFKEISFGNGFAEVTQFVFDPIFPHRVLIKARIENQFIREAFEYIKEYFSRLLKIKEISVRAEIKFENRKVTVLKASSPEIAKIGPNLIAEVKVNYLKKEFLKKHKTTEVLTVDQVFSSGRKKRKLVFNVNDAEFIDELIRIKKPKHGEQIKYLVKRHNYKIFRLRILTNPLSFLFFLTGKSKCYLAWETLFGTDGTYLWTLPQNLQSLLKNKNVLKQEFLNIEQQVKKIREIGRLTYLKNKPDNFIRIFHNYREKNGFAIWKREIEALLKE